VEARLKKGIEQLQEHGGAGIIAFNLDSLTPENSMLSDTDRETVGEHLNHINTSFLTKFHMVFADALMSGKCDGILVSTSAFADVHDHFPRMNLFSETALWLVNEADPQHKARAIELTEYLHRAKP